MRKRRIRLDRRIRNPSSRSGTEPSPSSVCQASSRTAQKRPSKHRLSAPETGCGIPKTSATGNGLPAIGMTPTGPLDLLWRMIRPAQGGLLTAVENGGAGRFYRWRSIRRSAGPARPGPQGCPTARSSIPAPEFECGPNPCGGRIAGSCRSSVGDPSLHLVKWKSGKRGFPVFLSPVSLLPRRHCRPSAGSESN